MKTIKCFFSIVLITSGIIFGQTNWEFDKPHTKIGFSVTHLVITEVEGKFGEYEGSITTENEDFGTAKINLSIDVNSIQTDIAARDKHLKSDDFFNAEKFPQIKFKTKALNKVSGKKYKMVGDLTIRDVTREIVLDVVHRGTVKGPMGNTRAGFKLTGELNRFDFGLKWNKVVEAGPIVDENIKLLINLELIKKS